MGNHLHRDTVKRRISKGVVKRRPLVDDPLSAGTFCFKAHRYSLFHGVPAAYCLPRQFADPEVCSVLLRTAGKQQDINRRLKIQLPKGVHLNRPPFKLWGRSMRPHPNSGRCGVPVFRHTHLWGRGSKMCAVSFSDFSEKSKKHRNMLRRCHFWQRFFVHKWSNRKVHRFSPRVAKNLPNTLGNMHRRVHAVTTCGDASP